MAKVPKRGHGVDKKGRSKGEGQYWKAPYCFLEHPSWRTLPPPAKSVYLELRTRFNGGNNGALSLSYEEASSLLAMSKGTVARAFCALEDRGFITKTKPGHWYGRQATLWALTDRPLNGHLATNDWQKWKPTKATAKNKSRYSDGT